MSIERVSSTVDIAVSGLRAQAARMNVIANNVANVNTTHTDSGQPYRRKEVVFSTESNAIGGVSVSDAIDDVSTPLKRIRDEGNPDADKDGFVTLPNIDLPIEMMNMTMASRAYQANAAILKRQQDLGEAALELLR